MNLLLSRTDCALFIFNMNMDSPFPGLSLIKDNQVKRKTDSAKEIQVFGVGEIILFPDICKIQISVSSVKDDAPTAKNSVIRRLEYILQSAYNHRVKVSDIVHVMHASFCS